MRQQALTVNELLRHFWAAMPMELPGRQPKAQRMADELQVLVSNSFQRRGVLSTRLLSMQLCVAGLGVKGVLM